MFQRSDWLVQATAWLPCRVHIIELGGVTKPTFYRACGSCGDCSKQRQPDVVHTFLPHRQCGGRADGPSGRRQRRAGQPPDYGYWITPGYLKATGLPIALLTASSPTRRKCAPSPKRIRASPPIDWGDLQRRRSGSLAAPRRPQSDTEGQIGHPRHHRVIALVANYRPIKRHDTLLHATRALIDKHPTYACCSWGEQCRRPCMDEVLALAQSLGLQDQVHRGHAKGDIADYLSIMHIGCNCWKAKVCRTPSSNTWQRAYPPSCPTAAATQTWFSTALMGWFSPSEITRRWPKLDLLLSNEEIRKQYALAGQNKVRRDGLPVRTRSLLSDTTNQQQACVGDRAMPRGRDGSDQ